MGAVGGGGTVMWAATFGRGSGGADMGSSCGAFHVVSGVWASTVGALVW